MVANSEKANTVLHLANLSSEGINVHEHGGVSIPSSVKFKTHYSVCSMDNAESYRIDYLKERWHYFNRHLFGGLLKEPAFRVTNKTRKLGTWFPTSKRIEIAKKMFKQPNDINFLGTLVHEMAHQYDDTILFSGDLEGHGPAWQHIMQSIGLTSDPKYRGPELKTTDRLQKEKEVKRILDNNQSFDVESFRSDKYEVLRYVNPSRMKDVPVIVDPVEKQSMFLHGWEVKKDGSISDLRATFNASFVVIPGPLKIRTPLYKKAQSLADKMNMDIPG